jgi:hypothetical protein
MNGDFFQYRNECYFVNVKNHLFVIGLRLVEVAGDGRADPHGHLLQRLQLLHAHQAKLVHKVVKVLVTRIHVRFLFQWKQRFKIFYNQRQRHKLTYRSEGDNPVKVVNVDVNKHAEQPR